MVVGSLEVPNNNRLGQEMHTPHQFMLEIEDGQLVYWDVNKDSLLKDKQYGRIITPFLNELADSLSLPLVPAFLIPRYTSLCKKARAQLDKSTEASVDGGCGYFVDIIRFKLHELRK